MCAITPTLQAGRKHPVSAFCGERLFLLNSKKQASNTTTKENIMPSMKKGNPIVNEEEKSTASSTSTTRPRRVSFAHHGKARKTLSLQDYTQEEIESTWYTQEEYQAIRKSVAKQIFKVEAGEELKDVKYCSRGLEGQTKLGYLAKSKARIESIAVVLDIQDALCTLKMMVKSKSLSFFQAQVIAIQFCKNDSNSTISTCPLDDEYDNYEEENDGDDDEKIAYVYRQTTSSCQLWAMIVGQQDALAAEDI